MASTVEYNLGDVIVGKFERLFRRFHSKLPGRVVEDQGTRRFHQTAIRTALAESDLDACTDRALRPAGLRKQHGGAGGRTENRRQF